MVNTPRKTDWLRWPELSKLTRVFCDQSVHNSYGIEQEDILRLSTNFKTDSLFPNLRKVFLLDSHLHPMFLAPNLSQLNITICRVSETTLRTSCIKDAASWICDHVTHLQELQIFPPRAPYKSPHIPTRQTRAAHIPVIECLIPFMEAIQLSLTTVGLPPYYMDHTMLLCLMDCPNLRSITVNQFPTAGNLHSYVTHGPRDHIWESYLGPDLPPPLRNFPSATLRTLHVSLPYAHIATCLLSTVVFPKLGELTVEFTLLQPTTINNPPLSALSLAPFFVRLEVTAPLLEHLCIYMMPTSEDCNRQLANVPVVDWSQLGHLRQHRNLIGFEIYHVYPIEVSVQNIMDIMINLPDLRTFILNPHPVIASPTIYTLEALLVMARWGLHLTHIGIFIHDSDVTPIPVPDNVSFRYIKTFYFGNSLLHLSDNEYHRFCHSLYMLFHPSVLFEPFSFTSAAYIPSIAFSPQGDGTLGVPDTSMVSVAASIWEEVRSQINSIRETCRLVGATRNVREEDRSVSIPVACHYSWLLIHSIIYIFSVSESQLFMLFPIKLTVNKVLTICFSYSLNFSTFP